MILGLLLSLPMKQQYVFGSGRAMYNFHVIIWFHVSSESKHAASMEESPQVPCKLLVWADDRLVGSVYKSFRLCAFIFFSFFLSLFFFFLVGGTLVEYGGSLARSLIQPAAASLHHSHGKMGSDLHHSSCQCWILNPLSKARDQTLDTSRLLHLLSHNRNSLCIYFLIQVFRGVRNSWCEISEELQRKC